MIFCLFYFILFLHFLFKQLVPSAPPQDVHGRVLDSKSLKVFWKPPPANKHHGTITYYKVLYSEDSKKPIKHYNEINVTANEHSLTIKSLKKWTHYRIAVLAGTKIGDGPASPFVTLRTDEDGRS